MAAGTIAPRSCASSIIWRGSIPRPAPRSAASAATAPILSCRAARFSPRSIRCGPASGFASPTGACARGSCENWPPKAGRFNAKADNARQIRQKLRTRQYSRAREEGEEAHRLVAALARAPAQRPLCARGEREGLSEPCCVQARRARFEIPFPEEGRARARSGRGTGGLESGGESADRRERMRGRGRYPCDGAARGRDLIGGGSARRAGAGTPEGRARRAGRSGSFRHGRADHRASCDRSSAHRGALRGGARCRRRCAETRRRVRRKSLSGRCGRRTARAHQAWFRERETRQTARQPCAIGGVVPRGDGLPGQHENGIMKTGIRIAFLTPAFPILPSDYGTYFRLIAPIPAATVKPVLPSIETGCNAIERSKPPTSTLAPTPTPTVALAVAPA